VLAFKACPDCGRFVGMLEGNIPACPACGWVADDADLSLRQLQKCLEPWWEHNFPDASAMSSTLGVAEEFLSELLPALVQLGNLCHAVLKEHQGIRYTPEQVEAKIKDAIGDINVFSMHVCHKHRWYLQDILTDVVRDVTRRDWKAKPLTAGGVAEQA
jgi:hypothetical protein